MKIALALAAGLLAASSMSFAADNNGGNNGGKDGMKDNTNTGSIMSNDGNNVSIEDREFCVANPKDSKCQGLVDHMKK